MKLNFSSDDAGTKLILLYTLEQMEIPLSEHLIFDICTSRNDWINYMECKMILPSLVDFNLIYTPDSPDCKNPRYTLTAMGRSCLASFYQDIPDQMRAKISEFCKANRMYFKRLQEYVADFKKNSDGTYMVVMKIIDATSNTPSFEIKINLQSRAEAVKAVELWREKAPNFYEFVYTNLLDWTTKGE